MRAIFFAIVIAMAGCSTQQGEGIPSNSFPGHKLNFLFNERLALDYSELDADDWKIIHQDVQGRYALTEFIPKKESEEDWTQSFRVVFYPKITLPKQYSLEKTKVFLEQSTPWSCLKDAPTQTLSQTAEEMMVVKQGSNCDTAGNHLYQIIRLVQTDQGIHQLSYLARGIQIDPLLMEQYTSYLMQAKVISKRKTL